jgi:predicted O-linked N-acetylglucosamine transferase (SPINDLY family)
MGKPVEAAAQYRRALELEPDYFDALNNLGVAWKDQGRPDEAIACFQQVLQRSPQLAEVWNNLGNALRDRAEIKEALACYQTAMELKPEWTAAYSNYLYTLYYDRRHNAASIAEEHRRWNERFGQPLAQRRQPHQDDPFPQRRLKIGYVAPDFCSHCQSLFTVPVFRAHDHSQFEIFCYSDVTRPDEVTQQLQGHVDQWRNVVGLSDEEVAKLVRDDQIDILVDLTLHMPNHRLLVFARKPAPVQVTWLGYPGTTGLRAMDYRLTDPHLNPSGRFGGCYAEESIRLPETFWCYHPLTEEPPVSPLPALQSGVVTFGCLNNFCKVNSDVLKTWAGVMKAVHRSRLLLLAPEGIARERTVDVFQREGISADRISFVTFRPRLEYLASYHQIDIGLDTFPVNGHTTSLDAFWMGVPVVTLVGQTEMGRAGLSLLSNLGLPQLAAATKEQFISTAVEFAADLSEMNQLRQDLRQRMERSPLMNAPRFTRNLEAVYRSLWIAQSSSRNGRGL